MKNRYTLLLASLFLGLFGYAQQRPHLTTFSKKGVSFQLYHTLPSSGFHVRANGEIAVKACHGDQFDCTVPNEAYDTLGNPLTYNKGMRELFQNKKLVFKALDTTITMVFEHNWSDTIKEIALTHSNLKKGNGVDTLLLCSSNDYVRIAGNYYGPDHQLLGKTCGWGPDYFKINGVLRNTYSAISVKEGDELQIIRFRSTIDSCEGCYVMVDDSLVSQKVKVKVASKGLSLNASQRFFCLGDSVVLTAGYSATPIAWYNRANGPSLSNQRTLVVQDPGTYYYVTQQPVNGNCTMESEDVVISAGTNCPYKSFVKGTVHYAQGLSKGIPNVRLQLTYQGLDTSFFTFTNEKGEFSFKAPFANTNGMLVAIADPNYVRYDTLITTGNTPTAHFLTLPIFYDDLSVQLSASRNRPGFQVLYYTNVMNNGNLEKTATLHLELDQRYRFDSASVAPTSNVGNKLTWNLAALPSQWSELILVYATLNAATPLETLVKATAILEVTDEWPYNDTASVSSVVVGSFDPNDKTVKVKEIAKGGHVADTATLDYTIRFQNMGTDTAFTVVVKDKISPFLDLGTLAMVDASHPYRITLVHDTLVWTFKNILLPDNKVNEPRSHGHVHYRIKPKVQVPNGAKIRNQAGIYFDFNEPVITNEVVNTVGMPDPNGLEQEMSALESIHVFPNPTEGVVRVHIPQQGTLRLHDLLGKQVWEQKINQQETILLEGLPKGLYHYQLSTEGKTKSGKLFLR